jgi:hypothetical protein
MSESIARDELLARKVREWLLALLRFAITLEPADRSAVRSFAYEMDSSTLEPPRSSAGFFRRETAKICSAIVAVDGPKRISVLKGHIARIEHPRLRQAFAAAVEFGRPPHAPSILSETKYTRKRTDLWKGLQR